MPGVRFLCVLRLLVSESSSTTHPLLSTIIPFIMGQVYPAVSEVTAAARLVGSVDITFNDNKLILYSQCLLFWARNFLLQNAYNLCE